MALPVAVKAALLLNNEKTRRGIAWVMVIILSPVILIVSAICALAGGGAEHNNAAVNASFYGTVVSEKMPSDFQSHISEMQAAFSLLDSAVAAANAQIDTDGGLDPIMVKAVFFALCFGEDSPSQRAANRFVECFYTTEERTRPAESEDGEEADEEAEPREEAYTAIIPLSLESAYANLTAELGIEISDDDRENITHIYTMVAGPMGVDSYDGAYSVGGAKSVEIDIGIFSDPSSKNASDLAAYAVSAWESGWGYVWGTYGQVLTDSLFYSKLQQYPEGVGNYADFIRSNWVGGRAADCVGLIKGYGWLDPETSEINYGTNGMPDVGANQMYYNASVSGTIDSIPDTPGLAVWHDGHIGVYIGGGEVIEAMGTMYGVVKTQLEGRGWTHWLQVPYINYY